MDPHTIRGQREVRRHLAVTAQQGVGLELADPKVVADPIDCQVALHHRAGQLRSTRQRTAISVAKRGQIGNRQFRRNCTLFAD